MHTNKQGTLALLVLKRCLPLYMMKSLPCPKRGASRLLGYQIVVPLQQIAK